MKSLSKSSDLDTGAQKSNLQKKEETSTRAYRVENYETSLAWWMLDASCYSSLDWDTPSVYRIPEK